MSEAPASGDCPRSWLERSGPERLAPLEVALRIDEVAVALNVAGLCTDDQQDEVVVAGVRHLARRRRLDVHQRAGAELAHLAADLDAGRPAVDEVQLVLRVV